MDNEIKRPSAALINREWFDAARSVLSTDDMGLVMVNAACYVFGLPECAGMNQVQRAVFAMIKPALDSDVEKYTERCARNAANARSQSQRVAPSGTQSQRVGANTNTTTTTTTTTTPSLSPVEVKPEDKERERWLLFGYFVCSGSCNPDGELTAFWSYYESLGWKNNKGAAIVSKLAAARMWRRQFETKQAPDGAPAWFNVVKECPVPDWHVWQAYAGAERTETGIVIRLRCTDQYLSGLRKAFPAIDKALAAAYHAQAVTLERIGS